MKLYTLFVLLLFSCSEDNRQSTVDINTRDREQIKTNPIDSTNNTQANTEQEIVSASSNRDVKIKSIRNVLEKSIQGDTLTIVTTDDFLFYPFGLHHNIEEFIGGNDAFVKNQVLKTNDSALIQKLTYEESYLLLFPDKRVGGNNDMMEIVSGEITDGKVELENGVKIGCARNDFLHILSSNDAADNYSRINVFRLTSGLDGIYHLYTFNNNRLISIEFVSAYQLL